MIEKVQPSKLTPAKLQSTTWSRALGLTSHPLFLLITSLSVYLTMNWMVLWNITAGAGTRSVSATLAQTLILLFGYFCAVFGGLALRSPFRWLFGAAFVLSVTINLAAYTIIGSPPTRATGIWLFSETGQLNHLLRAWGGVIGVLTLFAVMGVGTLMWAAQMLRAALQTHMPARATKTMLVIAVVGSLALPVAGGIAQARMGLTESNLYAFGIVALRVESVAAEAPPYRPTAAPVARKIVLVIDESTRPDVFAEVVLPHIGWPMVNYHVAYSNANCSAASNALIRLGIEPGKIGIRHDPRAQPSLWAYAKNAGLTTTLIDGQLDDENKSQNFIGAAERAQIDTYIAADIGTGTDDRIAHLLADRLRTEDKELIVVVKRGNHFPYAGNLPNEARRDNMTLKEAYRASMEYTTGRFFEVLMGENPTLEGTLLFYTSDHGQYQGNGRGNTHCRSDHLEDEYRVPMVIASGNNAYLERLAATKECWDGGAHHQALRSSVIEALGYATGDILSELYPPLTFCTKERTFPRFLGFMPFPTASDEKLDFELMPFRASESTTKP